jgi:hypothetical protein
MRDLTKATTRRLSGLAWMLGAMVAATTLHGLGCVLSTPVNCENDLVGCPVGTSPGCDPSTTTSAVSDTCGIFVSPSGDDGNQGTKEKPLKTLGAALGKGMAIYACAGATPFSEVVTVNKAVTLFGAMDCTSWAYDATNKTQLTAAADAVPLTLTSAASGSELHDFAITAADATTAGASSIAIVDDGASVLLKGVSVTAGAGAAGATGMAQTQVATPSMANGQPGADDAACSMAGVFGGAGGTDTCSGTDTSGGVGGDGLAAGAGGNGGDGFPMTAANGGTGETSAASCNPGTKGSDGSAGTPGMGARGIGEVSATGYVGATGTLGAVGTPGQGGGGGGGALACDPADTPPKFAGPSGGGGGAGGCPGGSGNPGQSGGSSIGILAIGATLALTTVSITTNDGGAGGAGGDGQRGASGGLPGAAGAASACGGGPGGQGGAGGPGGGGAGGHSVAVAVKGGALPSLSSTTIVPGVGGAGGPGGDMSTTAQTRGDDGMACATLSFTAPTTTACAM